MAPRPVPVLPGTLIRPSALAHTGSCGLTSSLGAAPHQVVLALNAAQLLPALAAALAGIPAGLELYTVIQGPGPRGTPPGLWLFAMVLGILLTVGGLAATAARACLRQSAASILQADMA